MGPNDDLTALAVDPEIAALLAPRPAVDGLAVDGPAVDVSAADGPDDFPRADLVRGTRRRGGAAARPNWNAAGPVGSALQPALFAGEEARVRLGASRETPSDVLAALAADPAVTVRAAVAMNATTPDEANTRLALDGDERVRALLARKVAALIPNLPANERGHLQARALASLKVLVADEAVKVREAIADVVKSMPEAPRDLILLLAGDLAISVSEPVIRLSPILSSADLLAILASPPCSEASLAIARRRGVNAEVSDAIVAGPDERVIAALLENPTSTIRESAINALIARAANRVAWHQPLVLRPALSSQSARALSEMVATHLLETLAERADLDPDTTAALRDRLIERLLPQRATRAPEPDQNAALAEAKALRKADMLNERRILDAALHGDARRAAAMLCVSAEVALPMVERAAQLRNAKALVSLVWKAGFSMRLAIALQALLAGLGPDVLMRPTFGGGFPLSVDEMRWQLDCLSRGLR